ncbi:hypothetical protein IJS77_00450 [bacterium]|nr:hypothetical protein [bacterium]
MKKLLTIIIASSFVIGLAFADTLTIQADKQVLDGVENKIHLDGKVKVQINDVTLTSPRAVGDIDPKTNKLKNANFIDNAYAQQIKGSKKHEIKAEIIKMSLLTKVVTATGDTQSIVLEQAKPIVTVNADEQAYDTKTDIMTAKGAVIIHYKDIETFSDSAKANLTSNGDLKRMEIEGGAKIRQKDNKLDADKFVYNAQTEEFMAQGHAFSDVKPDEDTRIQVWSNFQQYNKKSGIILASGTVKVVYNDYTAWGPRATVFPDPATGKLNKIVFQGRSKIAQNGRTIEANHITMTMEPKNFTAEGNVVTVIPNANQLRDEI